jgi:hypothetical protein
MIISILEPEYIIDLLFTKAQFCSNRYGTGFWRELEIGNMTENFELYKTLRPLKQKVMNCCEQKTNRTWS